MTFFVYFDLIIKNNIASFLVVLIIGKVVYFKGELKTREKCVQFGQFASSYLVILDRSLLWRPHSHYTCWQHWWLVTHQRDKSWHRDTHSPSVITSQSWKSNSVLTLSCSHLAPATQRRLSYSAATSICKHRIQTFHDRS